MQLFKTLLAGATFVVSVAAQGRLRFTSFKPSVEVGNPVTVTWAGGSNAPVTITLRKGESTNLHDVAVLTSSGTGGSYTWVPESSLEDAANYALQISQGDDINYTGQFSIDGGSGSPEPPTTTEDSTATTEPTATSAPTSPATTGVSSSSVTPSSSPTPSSSTPSSSIVTSKSSTSSAMTTSDGGNTVTVNPSEIITATDSSSAPTASSTGGATSMGSPLGLVMGIFAAVAYFN